MRERERLAAASKENLSLAEHPKEESEEEYLRSVF